MLNSSPSPSPSSGTLLRMIRTDGPGPGAATLREKAPRLSQAQDALSLVGCSSYDPVSPSGALISSEPFRPSRSLWRAVLEQTISDLQATQHAREALEARAFLSSPEGRSLVQFFGGSLSALTKLLQDTPIPDMPKRIRRRKG